MADSHAAEVGAAPLCEQEGWRRGSAAVTLRLFADRLELAGARAPISLPLSDVAGASCAAARLSVCSWPHASSRRDARARSVVVLERDEGSAEAWARILSYTLRGEGMALLAAAAAAATVVVAASGGPLAPLLALAPAALPPPLPPRSLLVFVNPVAGKGRGASLWASDVAPMLADAGCACEVLVTTASGEAAADVRRRPRASLARFDGVVGVGGDGSLGEVVDALMSRPDWRSLARTLVLGIIPTGSGNGLAVSICAAAQLPYSVANCGWAIVKGGTSRIDLAASFVLKGSGGGSGATGGAACSPVWHAPRRTPSSSTSSGEAATISSSSTTASIESAAGVSVVLVTGAAKDVSHGGGDWRKQQQGVSGGGEVTEGQPCRGGEWGSPRWSFLSLEWGLIADVDIESERLRCLGDARFDVYAAVRALRLRRYRGRFSYLPTEHAAAQHPVAARQHAALPLGRRRWSIVDAAFDVGVVSPSSSSSSASSADDASGGSEPLPRLRHLVPFDHPVPSSWVSLEGVFTYLWAINSSHQSVGVSSASGTHHNDGSWTVTLVRDSSPCAMIGLMLAMDNDGTFSSQPGVVKLSCAAWRLEPEPRDAAHPWGHVALDGEDVPYGPVQAEVHPGLLSIFAYV